MPIARRRPSLLWGAALVLLGGSLNAQTPPASPPKLTPAEAAKTFTVPAELRLDQVLAEPTVRQPVAMTFDERGRLWVVQYLQYPRPAGLKLLSRDVHWRAVYDKVPPPPPHHFPGQDKITIHEDTDGDGVFDKHSVFVEGLNIVTSVLPGRGGVWVLNPPYLLFYPTKPGSDTLAGDPVVHLQGFGLEDTHSCASSLHWGPDGWIYGSHGSTVTANITRPGTKDKPIQMIGQHIWRYHPDRKIFEIFAEGGGNAFGVEIDRLGRVYSGHNGGDTRGFHYEQGAYYRKGFEKHGVLANPYAFGFFEAMKSNKAPRFSHTFVINEAGALPAAYRGQLFAVVPLMSHVMRSEVLPDGSSSQTKDLGPVVATTDTWFRPVDIKPAPDGSLYIADFYEARIDHLTHNADKIDRDSGRIYRLTAKDARPSRPIDLGRKCTAELVELLKDDNRWVRETALRLLGDRRDKTAGPLCRRLLFERRGQDALEGLWALHLSAGLDAATLLKCLRHAEPAVRAWAVRLSADRGPLGADLVQQLAEAARTEPDVHVRSQWACSAKRLPATEALPLVRALLSHDEDAKDIHVPLLLWWAVEAHCGKDRGAVVDTMRDSTLWRHALVEETLLPRLMRRFATAGSLKDLEACTELFRLAPERKHGLILLKGFEEAFKGRSIAGLPAPLLAEIGKLSGGSLAFGVRQGRPEALAQALKVIDNAKAPLPQRLEMIETFGEANQPLCVEPLLALLTSQQPEEVRKAALAALASYKDVRIGAAVVQQYPQWSGELRELAEGLLAGRREWSSQWLEAVDAGRILPRSVPLSSVRKLLLHKDAKVAELVRKHWGEVRGATTDEMKKEIERLVVVVSTGGGDPYIGKKLFTARCANCHTLHAHGAAVGPDLTPYKRDDLHQMLVSIVNPSAEIREGFENHVVVTESGRTLTGVLLEKDARVVVLRTTEGQKVTVPRDDIAEMSVVGASLMPEGLLQGLPDQEVRDLFAYLRTSQPLFERPKYEREKKAGAK
jgi:putative heme-binding domain-containing protein